MPLQLPPPPPSYLPFDSYEVNPKSIDEIESAGLEFVGRDETGLRMEIAEIPREFDHTGSWERGGVVV